MTIADTMLPLTTQPRENWRGRSFRDWRTLLGHGPDGTVWFTQIELETQVLETTTAEWDAWVARVGAVRIMGERI